MSSFNSALPFLSELQVRIGETTPIQQPTQQLDTPSSSRFSKISVAGCEHLWSYLSKIVLINRNLLNCAARTARVIALTGEGFVHTAKEMTTYLKLLSIVGVPFAMLDWVATAKKIYKSFLLNDKEGVALALLSLTIISTDIYDSLTTFTNSALTIFSYNPLAVVSAIALPVGFALVGMGAVSRTIQITKSCLLYRQISKKLLVEDQYRDKQQLKDFLEEKLGIDQEIRLINSLSTEGLQPTTLEEIGKLKERKRVAILRAAPKETVEELEKLFNMLDVDASVSLTEQQTGEIFESLERVQRQLGKKMLVDAMGILSNLIVLSGLTLFALGTAGAAAFLLLALAFAIRLSALIYQDFKKIN